MSIRFINEDLDPNKQTNYYDGQQLDVDDMEQLQIFLNRKIERAVENIALNGVVDGLEVTSDTTMAEPFEFPTVAQPSTNPDLQNFRDFPEDVLDTADVRMYQVFLAQTNNIQRIDLKLQIIEGAGASTLVVELVELTVPTNPQSDLSLNTLYIKQFASEEIPSTTTDGRLVIDVSSENENQGITVTPGNYYAIQLRFIRETNSQDQLRVFHSNTAQTASADPDSELGAHFYINGDFQQGIFTEDAELVQPLLYHRVYTSAVQVSAGEAYFKGEHIKVPTAQRYLSLADRRNIEDSTEFANYVVIKFVLDSTDPENHPRTNNPVDSRYEDTFEVDVWTQTEWDIEVAKEYEDREWLLLAAVTDRNTVPFSERFELSIDQLTNLAYNDWLNPCISSPSLAALQIKAARPDDFIFYVDNIPAEVPLLNDDNEQVYSQLGAPLVDRVVRVFLILYLDGGTNTRRFEMALNTSTSTTPPFNSYFVTITDPEGELIPGLANFAFDQTELTPNTFYNYVAETERGRFIFIQDYNTQVRTPHPSTGILSLTRERMFEVNLNAGVLTAVINEDLHLGDEIVPYGSVGQRVIGMESILQVDEAPGRNGTTASQTITPITDSLAASNNFMFEPLPMCFEETGDLVLDTSTSVADAVAVDDIVIKIDGVPITYSGTEGPERGGTGAPHTVSGRILFSDNAAERLQQMQDLSTSLGIDPPVDENDYENYVGLRVTVRDSTGRDNSQQSLTALTHIDPDCTDPNNRCLVYRVIAMGRGTGSEAGFSTGERGYVYFENRIGKDIVGAPLEFTYTPFGASILDVREIETLTAGQTTVAEGTGEQWFGERDIVYATSSAGLALSEVGIHPSTGQVFWNDHDENLLFTALDVTATIEYFHLDEVFAVINYYYTRHTPWGTANDCAIVNEDVAIQDAIAQEWVMIRVNGNPTYTVGATTVDLTDPATFVAMHPGLPSQDQSLLPADKISLNPELGRIVFGADIKPDPGDEVTITYYHLRPIVTCATNALGVAYDSRFDFNLDGRVDETDLNEFQAAFGSSVGDTNYSTKYDFNNDGVVDNDDFNEFLVHFGTVASGEPSFREATESRLNSLLVFLDENPLRRLNVVRAVSEAPTTQFPLGRTVLFFDSQTPVLETGTYVVMFGYAVALALGINSVTVTTTQPVTANTNREVIEVFNEDDTADTRQVIDVASVVRDTGTAEVYDNTITFSPSITESGTWIVRTLWQSSGVGIVKKVDPIVTLSYENKHRRIFGPFKMTYNNTDFESDGTALTIRFADGEATMADGSADPSGLHLDGVPMENMRFSILLFVPVGDNKTGVWRWHHYIPSASDQGIRLEFNEFLATGSRFRGKNGVPVLQPFGVGQYQVDLRPKFAGGDIENDLSNVVVIRDDQIPNKPPIHNHTSDEEGGIVTSDDVLFEDPEARFTTGDVTDVVYQLQDNLQQQLNALTAQLADLQLDASQIIVSHPCLDAPSGSLTLADAINQIIDKIAWDQLDDCP